VNLATFRTRVRNAVKDLDASAYVWTNDEVDHAIDRALVEYSACGGRVANKLFSGDGSERTFDVSAETGFLYALAVEHPTGLEPESWVKFVDRSGVVRTDEVPASGTNNVRVYYARNYLSGDSTWVVPEGDLGGLESGAAGYLLASGAAYYGGRIAPSIHTAAGLRIQSQELLGEFRLWLYAVRARTLEVGVRPVWDPDDEV